MDPDRRSADAHPPGHRGQRPLQRSTTPATSRCSTSSAADASHADAVARGQRRLPARRRDADPRRRGGRAASSPTSRAEALAHGVLGAVSSFTVRLARRPHRHARRRRSPRSSAPGSSGRSAAPTSDGLVGRWPRPTTIARIPSGRLRSTTSVSSGGRCPAVAAAASVEASAVAAIGPVLVIAPFCLLALFVIWLLVRLVWDVAVLVVRRRVRAGRRAAVRPARSRRSC